jgi:hypothetical protein
VTETYLVSLMHDQRQAIIDRWVERLYDHSESLYAQSSVPELDSICEEGFNACRALLQGKKDPLLKDFVRHLLEKRDEWNLETPDILRFFWEFRKTILDVADQGGDPGAPNWKALQSQLEPCIEAGVIHLVKALDESE